MSNRSVHFFVVFCAVFSIVLLALAPSYRPAPWRLFVGPFFSIRAESPHIIYVADNSAFADSTAQIDVEPTFNT